MSDTDFYRWPVLEACQALHMHHTGSSDALSTLEATEMRLWLMQRRAVWSASTCKFDDFVLAIVNVTLEDVSP